MPRLGNEHVSHVPYNAYPTASAEIFIAVVTDSQWSALLGALESLKYPSAARGALASLQDQSARALAGSPVARRSTMVCGRCCRLGLVTCGPTRSPPPRCRLRR